MLLPSLGPDFGLTMTQVGIFLYIYLNFSVSVHCLGFIAFGSSTTATNRAHRGSTHRSQYTLSSRRLGRSETEAL